MKGGRRIAIGIPAALASILLAGYSVRAGVANVQAREASDEVITWSASASGPRSDTAASLLSDVASIEKSAPDKAYVHELQALISVRLRGAEDGMTRAKLLFSKASEGRPVWPYTWANLAHIDYELGQTGEEFQAALRHAAELGPWEPEVQGTVVNFGLAVQDEVSPKTRAAIDQMVSNAMRRNPLETLQIAERRGRLNAACQKLVNPPGETAKPFPQCR